jgi:cytochrome c oxidase subunit 2
MTIRFNTPVKLLTLGALTAMLAFSLSACGADSAQKAAPAGNQAASSGGSGTKEITITASNFQFDQTEIHVKKGDKIKLTFKNAAGAHGLEIPAYNVKLTKPDTVEFTADKAGTFDYDCAVLCGTGHDNMTGKLIVE